LYSAEKSAAVKKRKLLAPARWDGEVERQAATNLQRKR
jgi:hypothetical protein